MKKHLIIISLFFHSVFSFSQTERDNYDIYSKIIISDINQFNSEIDTIIIIKKMKEKQDEYLSLINEINFDNDKYTVNTIFSRTNKDTVFIKRYMKEHDLKIVMKNLISDFKSHPKIQIEKLNIPNVQIMSISNKEYISFFGKDFKEIDLGWKKIKEKYNTHLVFELSKIYYNKNFASVYSAYHCGGLCGKGCLMIFEKINNEWKVITKINLWMS